METLVQTNEQDVGKADDWQRLQAKLLTMEVVPKLVEL